jgi:hypothetical protein
MSASGVGPRILPSDVEAILLSPRSHTWLCGMCHVPRGSVAPDAQRSASNAPLTVTWPASMPMCSPGRPITRLTRFIPEPVGSSSTTMDPRSTSPVLLRARTQSFSMSAGCIDSSRISNRRKATRDTAAVTTATPMVPAMMARLGTCPPVCLGSDTHPSLTVTTIGSVVCPDDRTRGMS